ncbi:MAG TPA: bifunctional nuclease domain-containing protein [Candidatus Sulfomarinibacteraceae bacterium]|nr:bifunctional nuclease domain-containing protein [Candidatus Sulfomarinibacteraceae bacterium]
MVCVEPDPVDDATLVTRSLDGDRAAFGLLVERHRDSVERVLRAMFANLADVEDLVQESFLRAHLDLDHLRHHARFGAWVRAIAVNLARMEIRSGRLAVSLDAVRPGTGLARPSPERLAEQRELARRIRQAVAALPPAEREAISQVYFQERSHREAAQQLNTSVGAIKVRVYRGRRRLRKSLDVEFPARVEHQEDVMIEVTVRDVVAKVVEDAMFAQAKLVRPMPGEPESDKWLTQLNLLRVVLLAEKDGPRLLPIWVGPAEGEALILQLQGRELARPITFDLMTELLAVGDMQLESIAVSRIHETVFYGTLNIKTANDEIREVDCRPSDAINLAVRIEAPIYVSRDVMDQHAVTPQDTHSVDFLPHDDNERWVSLLKS